jgi:hypothetical protein
VITDVVGLESVIAGFLGRGSDASCPVDSLDTVCSALCELRGQRLLFYDCAERLDSVEQARPNDYQECVLREAPHVSP